MGMFRMLMNNLIRITAIIIVNSINNPTWGYTLASALIFKKIKQALGFDHCLTYASAAAPLSPDIKSYFMSIDVPIHEVCNL